MPAMGEDMDDDQLFVCFSEFAQASGIGKPPYHAQIKEFAAGMTESTFSDFYEKRLAWHWYPVIISGFSSLPVHGDLPKELTSEQLIEAIGYAAEICAAEDRKRFISALGLLSLLCSVCGKPEESPPLTRHFMSIREGVLRNAIDPNIPHWFNKAAQYQFSTGVVPDGYTGSFDLAGLNAPENGQQGYGTSLDIPAVDQSGWMSCPDGEDAIKNTLKKIKGGDFVLEFQRSAILDGYKFWIWLYRNVSKNPIYHWYVYVVTSPDGSTAVHIKPMRSVVNVSPEELVVQHVFRLSD